MIDDWVYRSNGIQTGMNRVDVPGGQVGSWKPLVEQKSAVHPGGFSGFDHLMYAMLL